MGFDNNFFDIFFSETILIFLESSEMHFDLIASKKFHNIIYGDIVVYSLRTLSTLSNFYVSILILAEN